MSFLQFGPWEPDSAGLGTTDPNGAIVLQLARNVYPHKTGYAPIPQLAINTANTLASTCKGMFAARTSAGNFVIFVGTTTKLYKYSGGAFTDYSRLAGGAYSVPASEFWTFAQFGSKVIACNINDNPQVIDVDTAAVNFADLAGTPPKARYVGVVGDFVILAGQSTNDRLVRNSAINSTTGWTIGTNLCDEQELPDGGKITGFSGGEYGWIVQERSIRRMIFQPGSSFAFRYERVEKQRGAVGGYSLATVENTLFFLSDDGFYRFSDQGLNPIGSKRVNQWFYNNSDAQRRFGVTAFADPAAPRIYWAFYATSNSTAFDRLLIYDWQLDRWSYSDATAQYWAAMYSASITLESLDAIYGNLETIPFSLDSPAFQGGVPLIAAIDTASKFNFLSSSAPQTAVVTTTPIQFNPDGRANLQSVEPIGMIDSGSATVTVRVGNRDRHETTVSYSPAYSLSSATGVARMKINARSHEFEITIAQSSGTAWTQLQGISVNTNASGVR